jgi:diguanylate cyclase (GGDEF)-like protein
MLDGQSGGRFLRSLTGRAWIGLRSTPRSRAYPVLGTFLALGMPVGLLFVRSLTVGRVPSLDWALEDVARFLPTYAYVAFSSLALVTSLGYLLGRLFDRERLLSFTDSLTGLSNRRYFAQRLNAEMSQARRNGRRICVLFLDVDHLKSINDVFGHKAGDNALVTVAKTLVKSVRPTDVVARLGGDEFALLLPETAGTEASALSQRIMAEVSQQREAKEAITVSIGISELSATASPEDVLAAADAALYRAKAAGGGRAAIAQLEPLKKTALLAAC